MPHLLRSRVRAVHAHEKRDQLRRRRDLTVAHALQRRHDRLLPPRATASLLLMRLHDA
jgi:hypothetical protein